MGNHQFAAKISLLPQEGAEQILLPVVGPISVSGSSAGAAHDPRCQEQPRKELGQPGAPRAPLVAARPARAAPDTTCRHARHLL